MSIETILVIVLVVFLLGGGGWYWDAGALNATGSGAEIAVKQPKPGSRLETAKASLSA